MGVVRAIRVWVGVSAALMALYLDLKDRDRRDQLRIAAWVFCEACQGRLRSCLLMEMLSVGRKNG